MLWPPGRGGISHVPQPETPACVSILCRREVYRILQEEGVDLPRYAVLNRDPDRPEGECGASRAEPPPWPTLEAKQGGQLPDKQEDAPWAALKPPV